MPTQNPRINITFDKHMQGILAQLAREENRSVADLARELIHEALERREDFALSKLANKRDKKGAKTVSHKDVWR